MACTLSYNGEHGVLELRVAYDRTWHRQAKAKSIYGAAWNSSKKAWEYPATADSARAVVREFDPDAGPGFVDWWEEASREMKAAQRARAVLDGTAEVVGEIGLTYTTEPFAHQRRYCEWAATRALSGLPFRANNSEQGTGKTKCEVDMTTWELERRLCTGMPLVFCPNSVKGNWCREFLAHGPRELYAPVPISGTCDEKLAAITRAQQLLRDVGLVPVLVVNYEVLSAGPEHSQRPVLDRLISLAKAGSIGKILFDEATAIKNTQSNRGSNAFKLARHVPIRVGMTGTPYSKHPTDVFNQMRVLSPSILGTSWAAFRRHHVEFGGWQNKEVVGYRNLEELREKVDRHSFRVLLEECVDLPEEVHVTRTCDMTPQQVEATADLKKQMMAELETEDGTMVLTATEAMVRILRFNQIASGWLRDRKADKLAVFDPNPKLELLLDYAREEVDEDEKAVVWCCFQDDVERVSTVLGDQGPGGAAVRYYGGNRKEREECECRFLEDPGVRWMVATPDAGGWGLNWQAACHCVFYSYDFDWEAMAQARARIRRITQRQRMRYVWLVAENPVTRQYSHGVSTGICQYVLDNLLETTKMAGEMTGDFAKRLEDPRQLWRSAMEAL